MPRVLIMPLGIVAGALVLVGVLFWIRSQIHYLVGRTSLRIQLFGFTLRRIRFTDIRRVGTRKRDGNWFNTESWANSWDGTHRGLVIHRLSGWRRRLLITPTHRYAFRHELRDAVARATGKKPEIDPGEETAEAAGGEEA